MTDLYVGGDFGFNADDFAMQISGHSKRLKLLSKVLKEYVAKGKSTKDFEEEFGCKIIMGQVYGIEDVKFQNDSNETMFMLKYDK